MNLDPNITARLTRGAVAVYQPFDEALALDEPPCVREVTPSGVKFVWGPFTKETFVHTAVIVLDGRVYGAQLGCLTIAPGCYLTSGPWT